MKRLLFLGTLALTGCATSSDWSSYTPEQQAYYYTLASDYLQGQSISRQNADLSAQLMNQQNYQQAVDMLALNRYHQVQQQQLGNQLQTQAQLSRLQRSVNNLTP